MKKCDYHHGNLKEELLSTAFDFIKENEVENLTLKVLSDKTDTSRSAIYRHFSSKDDLMETMILRGSDLFDESVAPILENNNIELVDRFYQSGKAYIAFAKNNPNLYRLIFGKKYAHIREEVRTISNENCLGFNSLKKAVEDGQKDGLLKKDDSYHQAIIIWASLHGISSLIIDGFMDVSKIDSELYDKMYKNLLFGLTSNKGRFLSKLFSKN